MGAGGLGPRGPGRGGLAVRGGGLGRRSRVRVRRRRGHPLGRSRRRGSAAGGGAVSPGDARAQGGQARRCGGARRPTGPTISRRYERAAAGGRVADRRPGRWQGGAGGAQMVPCGTRQPLPTVPGRAAARRRLRGVRDGGLGESPAAGDGPRVLEQPGDRGSPGQAQVGFGMSDLLAARSQMGVSLAFHIIFAVAGIAMPVMMVVAEHRWQVTGHAIYLDLAKRWSKGTAILFAVGAVSGTVLSFELGLLWPEFMRFAGPIIGMPFSLEGFAFFTEAIFLGIYLYGWDRISPGAHLAAGGIVALSGAASGVFVVIANAWMNAPAGFELVNGQAVNVDPLAAMANPAALPQAIHMTLAAYAATGFAVAGIHALLLLKDPANAFHRRALAIALIVGAPAAVLQPISGDLSARHFARHQPLALATPLGFIAVETGWMVTELGRQPWVIYGVLKTADAVTPMPGLIVPFLTFTLLYCFLGVIVAWLLYRQILRSPEIPEWRGFYMPVDSRGSRKGEGA